MRRSTRRTTGKASSDQPTDEVSVLLSQESLTMDGEGNRLPSSSSSSSSSSLLSSGSTNNSHKANDNVILSLTGNTSTPLTPSRRLRGRSPDISSNSLPQSPSLPPPASERFLSTAATSTRKRKRSTVDNHDTELPVGSLTDPHAPSSVQVTHINETGLLSTQETLLSATPEIDTSKVPFTTIEDTTKRTFSSPRRNTTGNNNPHRSPSKLSPSKPLIFSSSPTKPSASFSQLVAPPLSPAPPPLPSARNLLSPAKSSTNRGKSPKKNAPLSLLQPEDTIPATSSITSTTTNLAKGKSGGLAALAAAARTRTSSLFSSMVTASPSKTVPSKSVPSVENSNNNNTSNTANETNPNASQSQLDTNQYQRLLKVVKNTRISTPMLEAKRRVSLSAALGTANPHQNSQSSTKTSALSKALEEAATPSSTDPTSSSSSSSTVLSSSDTLSTPSSRTYTFPAINTHNTSLSWPLDHQLYTFIRFRSCLPFLWISPQCLITDDLVKHSLTSKFGIEGRLSSYTVPNLYRMLGLPHQQPQPSSPQSSYPYVSSPSMDTTEVSVSSIDPTILNIQATKALLHCGRYLAYPSSHWSTSILNVTSAVTERFYTKVIAELQIWERDYNARKSLEERSRMLRNKPTGTAGSNTVSNSAGTNRSSRTPATVVDTPANKSEASKSIVSPSTVTTSTHGKAMNSEEYRSKTDTKIETTVSRTKSGTNDTLPDASSLSKTLSKMKASSSSSPPFSNKKLPSSSTPFTSPRRVIPVVFRTRSAEDIAAALRQNIIGGNPSMKPLPPTTASIPPTIPTATTPSSTVAKGDTTKGTDTAVKSAKKEKGRDKMVTTEGTEIITSIDIGNPKSPAKRRRSSGTNNYANDTDTKSSTTVGSTVPSVLASASSPSEPQPFPTTSSSSSSTITETPKPVPSLSLRIPTFPSWLPGAVMSTSSTSISGTHGKSNRHRPLMTSITGVTNTNPSTTTKPSKPRVTTSLAALASSVANITSTTNVSSLLPSRTPSLSSSSSRTAPKSSSSSSSSSLGSPTLPSPSSSSLHSGYSPYPDIPPTAFERIFPILNSLTRADKDGIATWLDRIRRFQEALASVWSILSTGTSTSIPSSHESETSSYPSSWFHNHSPLLASSIPFFMLRFGPQERTGNVILIGKASFLLQLQDPPLSSSSSFLQPDTIIAIIARSNLRLRLCLNLAGVPFHSPLDTDLPAFDRTFTAANVGIQESLGMLEAALSNTGGIGVPVSKEALGMMAITLGLDSAGRDLARVAAAQDTTKDQRVIKTGSSNRSSKRSKVSTDAKTKDTAEDSLTKTESESHDYEKEADGDEDHEEISFAIPDNDDDDMDDNEDDEINDGTKANDQEHLKRSRFGITVDPNSQSELRGTADSATSLLVIHGTSSVQLLIQLLIDAVQPGAQLGSSLASMVTYHAQQNHTMTGTNITNNPRVSIVPRRVLLPLGTIALLGSGNPNTLHSNPSNSSLDVPQIITLPNISFRHACACELEMHVKQTSEEIETLPSSNKHRSTPSDTATGSSANNKPVFEKRWDLEISGPILPTMLPKLWGLLTTMQMREYTIRQTKKENENFYPKSSSSSSSSSSASKSSSSSILLYGGKDPYYIPPGLLKLSTEHHYTTTKFTHPLVYESVVNDYEPLLQKSAAFINLCQQQQRSTASTSSSVSSSSPVIQFLPWKSLASLVTVPVRASHVHPTGTISSSMVVETMRNHYTVSYQPDLYFIQQIPLIDYMNMVLLHPSTIRNSSVNRNSSSSSNSSSVSKSSTPKSSRKERLNEENSTDTIPILSLTDMKFRIDNVIEKLTVPGTL